MSQSEVDDIGRETSRAARAAGTAVAMFLARAQKRSPRREISSWSDLTWKERREMKGEISRALREERRQREAEAIALRQQITGEIHDHHAQAWQGHRVREDEQMSDWFARQQDLARQLRVAEERIATADLTDTERGQAVTALRRAHYLPMYRLPQQIFTPATGTSSLRARAQAALSRLRIGRAREHEAPVVARWEATQQRQSGGNEVSRQTMLLRRHAEQPQLRTDAQQREQPQVRDPQGYRGYTRQQLIAVQDLRSAELQRRVEAESGVSTDPNQQAWRITVDRAALAGLSREQIAWELDNVEANSRCHTTVTYRRPGEAWANAYQQQIWGVHADEAEAAHWTRMTVDRFDWEPGTQFEINANERGQEPFFGIHGGAAHVRAGLRAWDQQLAEQQRHRHQEHMTVSTATGGRAIEEPLTAKTAVLKEESRGVRADAPGRRVSPETDGRATATETFTSTVSGEEVRSQVGVRISRDGQVTAGGIDGNGHRADVPLMDRTRNQQAQARIDGLQKQIDGLTAERDRFRTERDEAVAKLVASTPPAQRYGSRQRREAENNAQATAAETDSPSVDEVEEPAPELSEDEN